MPVIGLRSPDLQSASAIAPEGYKPQANDRPEAYPPSDDGEVCGFMTVDALANHETEEISAERIRGESAASHAGNILLEMTLHDHADLAGETTKHLSARALEGENLASIKKIFTSSCQAVNISRNQSRYSAW